MKKVLWMALAMAMIGSLIIAGCSQPAPSPAPGPGDNGTPAPAPSDEQLTLTLAMWTTPPSPPGQAATKWKEMVEERTDGKVTVDIMHTGSLLHGENMIEGVIQGVADVGWNVSAFRPERFPLMTLLNQPAPYAHTAVPVQIAWDMYNKYNPEEFDGVKVIGFGCNGIGKGAAGFFTTFPVQGLDDLQGKELRATGTGTAALEKLGAAPVFLTVEETYEALQKNIVEGVYTTFEIIRPFKFSEVIDYITPFDAPASVMFLIVSEETWNSWPDYLKEVVEDMEMEWSMWSAENSEKEGQGGVSYAVEQGVERLEIPPAEQEKMRELLAPLWDDWAAEFAAKGIPTEEWLNEFNTLLDKYNAQY